MSHASRPKHTSRPPMAAESASMCADHMLVTNRLPNTDARYASRAKRQTRPVAKDSTNGMKG
jgi:hypothetical protein